MPKRVFATIVAGVLACVPHLGGADVGAGAYLAARSAKADNDFAAAARYFTRALRSDPGNPTLVEEAAVARVALGEVHAALPLARAAEEQGITSPLISILRITDLVETGAWDQVFHRYEAGENLGPLLDGLVKAWSHIGAGEAERGLALFEELSHNGGLRNFALYHRALALASLGRYDEADEALVTSGLPMSVRLLTVHAEVLSQLGRNDDALALISDVYGGAPRAEIVALRTRLERGDALPLSIAATAQDGIAEAFFTLATALNGDLEDEYTLLYCRIAAHLRPNSVATAMLNAELLERLDRFNLARATYALVPSDHPFFTRAAMGEAYALGQMGNSDAAMEVLESLAQSHGDQPLVHVSLGDQMRRHGAYGEAVTAYSEAIGLTSEPAPAHWVLYYRRGISHHRLGDWDAAEADLRRALELRPEAYEALNFLGYSLVERGEHLDEALDLIERAVAAAPDSGYIVDSLGWAYYRLGRYEDAVAELERAVELMPMHATINDHLGDALWVVGRHMEARFQWRRALSLDPSEDERLRILRKLDVGLDHVLGEEARQPQEARVLEDG